MWRRRWPSVARLSVIVRRQQPERDISINVYAFCNLEIVLQFPTPRGQRGAFQIVLHGFPFHVPVGEDGKLDIFAPEEPR